MKKIYLYFKICSTVFIILYVLGCKKENYYETTLVGIYPNPCDSVINIHLQMNEAEIVKMNLSDKKNGAVEVFNKLLPIGSNSILINLSNKNKGEYFLELVVGNRVDKIKIFKN